jgi:DNA-binding HxlR family transcriptional regulator
VKLKAVKIKLSDEMKEEIKKLREELASLKEQLMDVTEQKKSRGIYIDIGNNVRHYVEDVMESINEGIHGELERCILIGPRGMKIIRKGEPNREEEHVVEANFSKVSEVMSALGQEHRLKILGELIRGGKYINELQEKLTEITSSTLSSHLKVLEEAGLVVQEKVRGRYLITMPGRVAYKMALRITGFVERGSQE